MTTTKTTIADADLLPDRVAFEAWARNAVGQPSFAGKHVRDGEWSYNHNIMELAWRCWQAALLTHTNPPSEERIEQVARVEKLMFSALLKRGIDQDTADQAAQEVAAALEASRPAISNEDAEEWTLTFYGSPPGVTVWSGKRGFPDSRREVAHLQCGTTERRSLIGEFLKLLVAEHNEAADGGEMRAIREALEPFARCSTGREDELPDSLTVQAVAKEHPSPARVVERTGIKNAFLIVSFDGLTLGDFRRARAALAKQEPR